MEYSSTCTRRFLSTLSLRRATPLSFASCLTALLFLSTLSLRRATASSQPEQQAQRDFYPRSPCGERRPEAPSGGKSWHFYPRSPCGERPIFAVRPYDAPIFLSTLSLRRATTMGGAGTMISPFLSTLSLRRATGPDQQHKRHLQDFYPRSPCGERLIFAARQAAVRVFLSTLSLRRATVKAPCMQVIFDISIHALLAESDPLKNAITAVPQQISIHALLAESDHPKL